MLSLILPRSQLPGHWLVTGSGPRPLISVEERDEYVDLEMRLLQCG